MITKYRVDDFTQRILKLADLTAGLLATAESAIEQSKAIAAQCEQLDRRLTEIEAELAAMHERQAGICPRCGQSDILYNADGVRLCHHCLHEW